MKKLLLIIVVTIGFSNLSFGQMYVSPTSYVFVNDQFVYVKQDVNLNTTGNFYLRNNAQLLQGTTGAGANSGTGSLSVYQEGTTNNFQYNYWCSPVGAPVAAAGNNSFGITRLFRPSATDKITSTVAANTTALDGTATNSSLTISNRWIWKYIATNIYAPGGGGWQFVGAGTSVEPGLGFTMKGTSGTDNLVSDANDGVQNKPNTNHGQRYDFRGKPNDGNMTAAVSNVAGDSYMNLTLVGNPYPSAINLNHYLLENSGYTVDASGAVSGTGDGAQINNTAYFWEHAKTNATHLVGGYVGGYATYVPNMTNIANNGTYVAAPMNTYSGDGESTTAGGSSGNIFQRQFTPVGQGFMVTGALVSGTITMKNKYRVYRKEGAATNSQFERTSNPSVANLDEYWEEVPNVAGIDYTQIKKNVVDPKFKIHTTINDEVVYEDALVFGDIASNNYDLFDGLCPYDAATKVAYLTTQDGAKKLVISAQPFDIDAKFPIVFKTNEQATFKVKVSDRADFNLAENIYLHDKNIGVYYDIVNNEYNAVIPAGETANRFEITFKNYNETLGNNTSDIDSFQVFQNNNNSMLTITNSMNKDVTSLLLYDVTGKLVVNKLNLGIANQYEVSTSGLSDGIYIVKLTTKDNVSIDKKVSIYRK